jgi:hypothetical protein
MPGGDQALERISDINEDVSEIKLEVGLLNNRLEHLEESIDEVKEMLKFQGQRVPMWIVAITAIPSTLIALFLLVMTVLIYDKFGG